MKLATMPKTANMQNGTMPGAATPMAAIPPTPAVGAAMTPAKKKKPKMMGAQGAVMKSWAK